MQPKLKSFYRNSDHIHAEARRLQASQSGDRAQKIRHRNGCLSDRSKHIDFRRLIGSTLVGIQSLTSFLHRVVKSLCMVIQYEGAVWSG